MRSQFTLGRLRTAFTPSSEGLSPVKEEQSPSTYHYTVSRLSTDDSFCSISPSSSFSYPRSRPLSRSSISGHLKQFASNLSPSNSLGSLRSKFSIRRSPSKIELEQEEERLMCSDELLDMVEPRPSAPSAVGSFEDVLDGRL